MKHLNLKAAAIMLSLLVSINTYSQDFHYGIRVGANFSVQSGIADYYNNEEIRIGFSGGLFGNMSLSRSIKLQAEVNYDQKGGKSEYMTAKYDYITIPVLAKFYIGSGDRDLKFNLNVGPYAGFLVNAEMLDDNDNKTDIKDDTESIEFGAIAGLGLSYPVANNNIVFDLRLGLGINEFNKEITDSRNKYVGVSLAYEF